MKEKELVELVEILTEYSDFLLEELKELIPIGLAFGWKSSSGDKRAEIEAKLTKLVEKLTLSPEYADANAERVTK